MVLRGQIVASGTPERCWAFRRIFRLGKRRSLHFETRSSPGLSPCNPGGPGTGKDWPKSGPGAGTSDAEHEGIAMKDLLFIVVTSTFFVVAWLYARSCDKV
jgi:hypothetical protein